MVGARRGCERAAVVVSSGFARALGDLVGRG
jgi:hypothetical protein